MEVLRLNSPSAGYRNSRRSLCSRGSANTSPLCCCLGKRDEDLEFSIATLGKELLKPSLRVFLLNNPTEKGILFRGGCDVPNFRYDAGF